MLFFFSPNDGRLINLWNAGLWVLELQRKMAERIKVIPAYCVEGLGEMWWRHGDNRASEPPVRKIRPGCNQNLSREKSPWLSAVPADWHWHVWGRLCDIMVIPLKSPIPRSLSWPRRGNVQASKGWRFQEPSLLLTFLRYTSYLWSLSTIKWDVVFYHL